MAPGAVPNLADPRLQQAVSLEHPGAVIRNCVIANAPLTGVRIRQGVTLENNVIVNSVDIAVDATGGSTLMGNKNSDPPIIRHNTIVGTWVSGSPAGKGGAGGIGIKIDKGTVIESNVIALTANHGIWLGNFPLGGVQLKGNVFYRNLFANVKFYLDGKDSAVDDSDMDSLEELGFGALEENIVADPGLTYDAAWLDRFTLHAFNHGKVFKPEDWNALRKDAGLSPLTTSGEVFAPAYDVKKVIGLLTPKNADVKAGARMRNARRQTVFSGWDLELVQDVSKDRTGGMGEKSSNRGRKSVGDGRLFAGSGQYGRRKRRFAGDAWREIS